MSCTIKLSDPVKGNEEEWISPSDYGTYYGASRDTQQRKTAVDKTYSDRVGKPSPTSWMSRAQVYHLTSYSPGPIPDPFKKIKGLKFHFAVDENNQFIVTVSPVNESLELVNVDPVIAKINYRSDQISPINAIAVNQLQGRFNNQYLLAGNFPSIEFTKQQLLSMLGYSNVSIDKIGFEILLFPDPEGCNYFKIVEKMSSSASNTTDLVMSPYACPKQCYK